MLVTVNEILRDAKENHYGVIAATMFDETNVRVAIAAAVEKHSPIILNVNLSTDFVKDDEDCMVTLQMMRQRAACALVPVAINADHCRTMETVMKAIHSGFTSVMIDASTLEFEDNIAITKKVVEMAHTCGMSVEAELGCVGVGNPTDKDTMKSMGDKVVRNIYTVPEEAKLFVNETNVDALAVSIGNAHGPFAKNITPHIEFELLQELSGQTNIPLALHGGSGTGDENLTKACEMGISKINVASDLMLEQIKGFEESKTTGFSRFRFEKALEAYKNEIMRYIDISKSAGRIR